jgi:hypothetical protein
MLQSLDLFRAVHLAAEIATTESDSSSKRSTCNSVRPKLQACKDGTSFHILHILAHANRADRRQQ